MNPVPDLKSESTLDTGENDSAKDSSLDDYHGISTSHQPFDPSAYFDNYAFDDVFFQGLKGYESYHFGLGYGSPSTLISSPSAYPTSVTSLPSGTDHEFPFRTRTGSQIPQPMDAMPSPSTNSLNESFPSPSQSFGPSKETGSGVGAPVQTVRNSQLEKVSNFRLLSFTDP
jgi:hypothetical protein